MSASKKKPSAPRITAETRPLYLEKKVAEKLGLTREDLRYVRVEVLTPRVDWLNLQRTTVLTQAALDRVLAYLRKTMDLAEDLAFADCLFATPAEKKEGAAGPLIVTLTVFRLLPNARLLDALTEGQERVRVRVPSNVNFRPKMTLRARLERPGQYLMEGRCPRLPGRY